MYIHVFGLYIESAMKLEEAIQQKKFVSERQKANLNIMYTSSWITAKISSVLKPFGISPQQFNILRILNGQKGQPATVKLLTERMIDKMSNTSRLVEKLKSKGLVDRRECEQDRRRVDIFLTDKGFKVMSDCSGEIEKNVESSLNLTEVEAESLNQLLDKIRE